MAREEIEQETATGSNKAALTPGDSEKCVLRNHKRSCQARGQKPAFPGMEETQDLRVCGKK